MSEIIITRAGLPDRAFIRSVSERTWPSTYGHIISQEQIDFMLDWMYSDASLEKQMNTGCEFYIVSDQAIDTASLKENLLKDLAHQQGFLISVSKKLDNEKFVQNAKPEVLAIEQKKKADALARIQTIEESLAQLG